MVVKLNEASNVVGANVGKLKDEDDDEEDPEDDEDEDEYGPDLLSSPTWGKTDE